MQQQIVKGLRAMSPPKPDIGNVLPLMGREHAIKSSHGSRPQLGTTFQQLQR